MSGVSLYFLCLNGLFIVSAMNLSICMVWLGSGDMGLGCCAAPRMHTMPGQRIARHVSLLCSIFGGEGTKVSYDSN